VTLSTYRRYINECIYLSIYKCIPRAKTISYTPMAKADVIRVQHGNQLPLNILHGQYIVKLSIVPDV